MVRLCFLSDVLVFWASLSVATFVRLHSLYQIDFVLIERDRWICIGMFAAAALVVGCYRPERILDRFDSFYYTLIALGATGIAEFALVALTPVRMRVISRTELGLGIIIAAVLLCAWRLLAAKLALSIPSMQRFFYVLGNEKEGTAIANEIRQSKNAHAEARYVTPEALTDTMSGRREEGSGSRGMEEAILTLAGIDRRRTTDYLAVCERYCRHTYLYPNLEDMRLFPYRNLVSVAGLPLIELGRPHPPTGYLFAKRLIDVSLSGVGLIVLAPVLLATAVAVAATSRGGVLYRQERLGKNGKPFEILKFRSMVSAKSPRRRDHARAARNDARITCVGRFIRKYKIDELPQLLNVLKGDMSLVGPRPLWRGFFGENGDALDLWERRLAVRPGLTSLVHVRAHSFAKASDFLRYDLIYVNNLSLLTDLRILADTIRIVLSGKGSED